MKLKMFILYFIFFLLFLPVCVNAKEFCLVTSGTGSNIGDEVKCGTESFYVMNVNDNETSLIAKYNLFVGDKIDYIAVSDVPVMSNSNDREEYCMNLAVESGYHPYYVYPMVDNFSGDFNGCRVYEKIEYEHVLQDERAVGTKLVDGKSVLPLYGITYMNPKWGYDAISNGVIHDNVYDELGNLRLDNSSFYGYITGYKEELERQGFEVSSVSFITLSKMLDLLKAISGKDINVELEYPEGGNMDYPNFFIGKMDIKEYLGDGYKWVYDLTYWLGSGFEGELGTHPDRFNDYYVSNEGMLCAIGRGDCAYLPYPIGNGVRPLVTISRDIIKYSIVTLTDGNGSIEVVESAFGDEHIKFKVTSKMGYKLSKITITADSGEVVEFDEGEIIENDDGTVSVKDNAFTMPYDNVTINAEWIKSVVNSEVDNNVIINPETGSKILIVMMVLILNFGVGMYIYKRKLFKKNID